mmetsp:Transcript_13028/g.36536  ORF Transcript_13028/g.36536 Transcript_13028/m.36536 type:complete len:234 (-) Transcript_13028:488-1189(-)
MPRFTILILFGLTLPSFLPPASAMFSPFSPRPSPPLALLAQPRRPQAGEALRLPRGPVAPPPRLQVWDVLPPSPRAPALPPSLLPPFRSPPGSQLRSVHSCPVRGPVPAKMAGAVQEGVAMAPRLPSRRPQPSHPLCQAQVCGPEQSKKLSFRRRTPPQGGTSRSKSTAETSRTSPGSPWRSKGAFPSPASPSAHCTSRSPWTESVPTRPLTPASSPCGRAALPRAASSSAES